MVRHRPWGVAALAFVVSCSDAPSTAPVDPGPTPPPPVALEPPTLTREFRGMWIATVANIDWPSAAALPVATQRSELIALLDLAQSLRLTAVILQVRAAGDALYPSPHEPWSAVLAGAQGTDPGWDPLGVAISEAHARGLELHAWFNPFRAGNASDTLRLHAQHLARRRPELARVVRGSLWFDPGEADVQEHALTVVRDVAMRYDIDAVHIDDFFYPYPTTGTTVPVAFPDSATYARYLASTSTPLAREDWRRDNVNRFVERLYREVHAVKPYLKVGISPFGIWRPGNPPGITGLDAWRDIYADSRHWLQQGWLDYLAPQLYWAIGSSGQSFPLLATWWQQQNSRQRHLWPGLAAYRVADGTASAFDAGEITSQISALRQSANADRGSGFLLYNATALRRDRGGLATALRGATTSTFALTPPFPWLGGAAPAAPALSLSGSTLRVTPQGAAPAWWLVQQRLTTAWQATLIPGSTSTIPIGSAERLRVAAVDRAFLASDYARWP